MAKNLVLDKKLPGKMVAIGCDYLRPTEAKWPKIVFVRKFPEKNCGHRPWVQMVKKYFVASPRLNLIALLSWL
jgi:hypothetical protein